MAERKQTFEHDAQLVIRSLNKDTEAFALLYDRYANLIRALAYDSTQNLFSAEDVTQEAFLRAWRHLHSLNDPARFCAWLVGIAKQVCREHYRANRRFPQVESDSLRETPASILRGDNDLDLSERDQILLQNVAQLPEKERLAVHLFYLQQLDVEQIGETLEMSRSGVYSLLQRALKRLAHMLQSAVSLIEDVS